MKNYKFVNQVFKRLFKVTVLGACFYSVLLQASISENSHANKSPSFTNNEIIIELKSNIATKVISKLDLNQKLINGKTENPSLDKINK